MKILSYTIQDKYSFPKIIDELINTRRVCIFDIETTGLNRNIDKVILIGYMFMKDNKPVIKQIFAEDYNEEKDILDEFSNAINEFDLLISFNGRNFDLPFLNTRLGIHKLKTDIFTKDHIDIYQHLKLYKDTLNLTSFRLKSIESFLGINRKDTINGKESVTLYESYRKSLDKSLLDKILLHNYEDIYHLGKILNIYNYLTLDYREFSFINFDLNYRGSTIGFKYNILDISLKGKKLSLTGKTNTVDSFMDEIHHYESFRFEWAPSKGLFNMIFFVQEHRIDVNKYFHTLEISQAKHLDFNKACYKTHLVDTSKLILGINARKNLDPLTALINDTITFLIN